MTLLKTLLAPFAPGKASDNESAGRHPFVGLMNTLDTGWQIEPPVYVMADPVDRTRLVFRMVVWRDGRPRVVTVNDSPEVRQFLVDRHLTQESL